MSSLVVAFIVVMLIATVGSLFGGLVSMGAGTEAGDQNSERMMFTRVGLQAIAIALVLLLFLLQR